MRPTFVVEPTCSLDQLMDAFRRHLVLDAEDVDGKFSTRHGVLYIPDDKSRLWTPCLDLTVEERSVERSSDSSNETGTPTTLRGTFAPRPEVWTAFVFAIGTLVIVSIFSSIYGIAQLALGHPPIALLIPIAAFLAAGIIYTAALIGQALSISEMYRLRAFVDDCLREAEEASRLPNGRGESAR